MAFIKRYPNRKLYHLEAKKYIILEEITELIQKGEPIQVIDHISGEDLTARILTQIIQEQEKRGAGYFPQSLLEKIIRAGGAGSELYELQLLLSTYISRMIRSELVRRIQSLVNHAQISSAQAEILQHELFSGLPKALDEHCEKSQAILLTHSELESCLDSFGFPSQDDVNKLDSQVRELFVKLESLSLQPNQA